MLQIADVHDMLQGVTIDASDLLHAGSAVWLPNAAADSDVEFLHGMLEGMASIEARAYGLLRELGADPLTKVTGCISTLYM